MPKNLLANNISGKIVDEKSGASGTVFIVENEKNTYPKKIAYKSIKVDKLNTAQEKYFLDECELWFTKHNPYLVKAFYPLVINGLPFICMPYYSQDLKTLMLNNDFLYNEALVISCKITKALVEMQNSGIKYHQDFNPPNILVEDLQEKYRDYSSTDALHLFPRISDLGIADLIEKIGPTLGGGGGKFPFKAPEQYNTKAYSYYNPDVFALGIIIYMLFTNNHPNKLTKEKALNKNTSAQNFKKWAFSATITLENVHLEDILNKCLKADPKDRPLAIEVYNVLISELEKINVDTADKLKFTFQYFDKSNSSNLLLQELDALKNISQLPGKKAVIYEKLLKNFENLKNKIANEFDVIALSEYFKSSIISFDKNYNQKDILVKNALDLIPILFNWHDKIKVSHRYSQIELPGFIIQKSPDFRNVEVVSNYIYIIYIVLIKEYINKNVDGLFKKFNNSTFYSIYLYSKALFEKNKNDLTTAIELLEEAKKINSNEPLFDYMLYTWITNDFNQIFNPKKELEIKKANAYLELKKNHQDWGTVKKL
jgi:hypothetical protein